MKIEKPLTILIVEDEMGDLLLLEDILNTSKLAISNLLTARNMREVSVMQKSFEFDIVLLDLSLPDSTGIDSVVKLTKTLPAVPIVVLSGLDSREVAVRAISMGAQDYLVKGDFDEKLLLKTIQYSIERKKTLVMLESLNEKYDLINKASHDALWEWDFKTQLGTWGEGFASIFGYPRDQHTFNSGWIDKYIHSADRERLKQKFRFYIGNGKQKWRDQYRFKDASGNFRMVFDRGFVLYDNEGNPRRMIGAMADITDRKKLEEELEARKIEYQKRITEVTIESQEKERNELGRELHDNINQLLATVKLYLGMIKSHNKLDNDSELLQKSIDHTSVAIEEIRQLSHSLVDPTHSGEGLIETLKKLGEEVRSTTGLDVIINNTFRDLPQLERKKELMIYRMVQEQMNNIRKHARANKVEIRIEDDNNSLKLNIIDDGVGFDVSEKARGIGLQNIQSRVDFYNGVMNIDSSPGNGCKVELMIPL